MNYGQILEALDQASLFQLYRLHAAIGNQLDDPARIDAVKRALRAGQEIRYFVAEENRLASGRLLELRRTRAVIENLDDGKRWAIPFYLINLDGHEADIAPRPSRPLDRNRVKVGEIVSFRDRQGQEHFGEVVKLNQKTASVMVDLTRWRVAFGLLSPVIDGDAAT
ncbi:MAG: hypothetical protein K9L70_12205, partial [Thiohalocapsa sp.]|nr:hypothetical protein [Thiohalocapsa sp.]